MTEQAFKGTIKEGFERRYTVLNERDYKKYVTECLRERFEEVLNDVIEEIENGRVGDGKEPYNNYVVINLDEPYINEIVEIMKRNGHWGPDSNYECKLVTKAGQQMVDNISFSVDLFLKGRG